MVPGARRQPERLSGPQSLVDGQSDLQQRIGEAIGRATERLLSMQAEEGYWLVRSALSGVVWRPELGNGPGHAAGVDSVPAMARLEHLQHVVVDARDCHTAHNSLRLEAALVPAFARPRRRIIRKPGRARP